MHVLFPFGVRLSTWIMVGAFFVVAARQRNSRVLVAGLVWLVGYEAVWDLTVLATKPHPLTSSEGAPWVSLPILGLCLFWSVVLAFSGVRPDWRLMAIVAWLWVFWILIGFPVNEHSSLAINPAGEVFNEATKTLWGLAYLVPFLRDHEEVADQTGEVDERSAAGRAPRVRDEPGRV